ncbi:hypothetical protein JW960_02580 [candidate division KSB1 bacterium]|nr:hypothetical protein [candidate division KSB1 bacterium]
MGKDKKLCKWDKEDIQADFKKLKKLVKKPKYVCEKCGRAAREDSALCRPVELE